MRSRIALSAATIVAALVIITELLGSGVAGAATRARPLRHTWRPDSPSNQLALSSAWAGRAGAFEARAARMERLIAAYRSTHPMPAPAPVVAAAATAPAAPAPPPDTDAASTTTATWACIRLHESSDRFNTPTVPGGAYGFLESTWLSLGYSGWPYQAPYAVQSAAALYLYDELGWQPWSTRVVCGL